MVETAKILYQLYQYRALGYEYTKDINFSQKSHSNLLPNSLDGINSMVKTCYLCPLGKTRKNVVFGEGNPNARLMFIGEGPGSYEDQTGRPFVGRSGQLLTNIITNVLNLRREDVYIANIVKCRPPNNRVPNMDEANSCRAYLLKQIELVNPEIIVALGRVSYHHLTRDYDKKMHQVRGEIFDLGNAKLMPTFHPSFMLRNPSSKREVYKDMLRIKDMLS